MVFVHSRKDTRLDAATLRQMAIEQQCDHLFSAQDHERYSQAPKELKNARSRELETCSLPGWYASSGMARADVTS